jgi:HEAT repeat protein
VNHDQIWEIIKDAKIEDSNLLPQLLCALKHKEKAVIIGASLVLGRLKDERAVPSLIRAFLTTDREVGAAVAWALGQCGSACAVPFLLTAVQKGFVVSNACEALGLVGCIDALPVLFHTLISIHEDERVFAAKALGQLSLKCGRPERDKILESLAPLSTDFSRKVRMSAAVACEKTRY